MKYPDSATRKLYSKVKTIKHDRVVNAFIHRDGKLKGAWHFDVIQQPYLQITANIGRRGKSLLK